jgi:hypothetical protein
MAYGYVIPSRARNLPLSLESTNDVRFLARLGMTGGFRMGRSTTLKAATCFLRLLQIVGGVPPGLRSLGEGGSLCVGVFLRVLCAKNQVPFGFSAA